MKKTNKKNILYTGGTGTGKTYKAIEEAKKNGSFVILVPCRQLAYEVYIDYQLDYCLTGEINHGTYTTNTCGVMVYESAYNITTLPTTVIVDEVHFLTGCDGRATNLYNFMCGIKNNLIACTATDTLDAALKKRFNLKTVKLKALKKVRKIKCNFTKFKENILDGHKTIIFSKYSTFDSLDMLNVKDFLDENSINYGMISANTLPSERLALQLAFRRGHLQVIFSTNVLAQGLNFTCSNMLIEYNIWDEPELIEQKIGRLARFGTDVDTGYYYMSNTKQKIKKKKFKYVNEELYEVYVSPTGNIVFKLPDSTTYLEVDERTLRIGTVYPGDIERMTLHKLDRLYPLFNFDKLFISWNSRVAYVNVRYARDILHALLTLELEESVKNKVLEGLEVLNLERTRILDILNNNR